MWAHAEGVDDLKDALEMGDFPTSKSLRGTKPPRPPRWFSDRMCASAFDVDERKLAEGRLLELPAPVEWMGTGSTGDGSALM